MPIVTPNPEPRRLRPGLGWRLLHPLVIVTLLGQAAYSGWQVFVVMAPPGVTGPLGSAASQIPMDFLMVRRLYAIEAWIALVGLALYLAITEIRPRMWR